MKVTAKLVGGCAVFAGDAVHVRVCFLNDESRQVELAWGSVQAHCQAVSGPGLGVMASRQPRAEPHAASGEGWSVRSLVSGSGVFGGEAGTGRRRAGPTSQTSQLQSHDHYMFSPSRGERGRTVFESPTEILFVDRNLNPGESLTFDYRAEIPASSPPSYKGDRISFSYKLTVGTQLPGQPSHILKLPFICLPVSESIQDSARRQSVSSSRQSSRAQSFSANGTTTAGAVRWRLGHGSQPASNPLATSPSSAAGPLTSHGAADGSPHQHRTPSEEKQHFLADNPFLETSAPSLLTREAFLDGIIELTRRKQAGVYRLSAGGPAGVFGRMYLSKTCFRLGDDVVAVLHLAGFPRRCIRVNMSLRRSEYLSEDDKETHAVEAQTTALSPNAEWLSLTLPVPQHITPEFQSMLVNVSYALNFEFYLSKDSSAVLSAASLPQEHGTMEFVDAPEAVDVDRASWSIPVCVLPSHPSLAIGRSSAAMHVSKQRETVPQSLAAEAEA